MKFETEVFSRFNDKLALLSAGTKDDHNTMTIGWGGMGTLWTKPVITVYVKPIRYTFEFLNKYEYFTVSFYPEEMHDTMIFMGRNSGRNTDKDKEAGLTVKDLGKAVTYEEAEVTFLCKKIYFQDMVRENMPAEVVEQFYEPQEPHRIYVGEVVDIIRNDTNTCKQ